MDDLDTKYVRMTPTSKKRFAESAQLHVNGVSHNIRYFDPYPFMVSSSNGTRLTDVDSNIYTDYWMGHWSLILGHCPQSVQNAMAEQLERGWMYGTLNEQTMVLSDMLTRAVPAAERLRYVASGTEATMYAVRLARAATGRKIIVKIDGGWHGYTSDLLKTVNWPFTEPESHGIEDVNIVSVPYNDAEAAIRILNSIKADLAGIIIEPVLGGGGCIPASEEYLQQMQDFIKGCGGLFILDEIVTGFRFRYGCLHQIMGLDPDIVTLGKIVGGGMPMGVVAGHSEIMDLANTSKMSRTGRCYVGGGTFSANPLSMVAGAATLRALGPDTYNRINGLGNGARTALANILGDAVDVTGQGSLFMTHFLDNGIQTINNAADAARCNSTLLHRYHKYLMIRGIFFLPGKLGAFSAAHTKDDLQRLVDSTERFVADTF